MNRNERTITGLEIQAREAIAFLMTKCENNGDCCSCPLHAAQSARCGDCRGNKAAAEVVQQMLDKLMYHPLISLDELAAMRHEDDLYIQYLDGGWGRWERFCSVADTKYHGRQLTLIGAAALPMDKYGVTWMPYRQKPGQKQE